MWESAPLGGGSEASLWASAAQLSSQPSLAWQLQAQEKAGLNKLGMESSEGPVYSAT